jgi:metal-responsive CopG/Arc/MetJ family transcriptional regulator
MRTTVEIDNRQRAELLRLAAKRGEKGFSGIVREALDAYLKGHRARTEAVERARALQGTFDDDDTDEIEASVRRLREQWR